MKKSTKIIATVIALVLVMSFMVVGILAATSASASITSSVSWEATSGIKFSLDVWTIGAKESVMEMPESDEESTHYLETITVDTSTSNDTASGLGGTLNTTFEDTIDDGVNNPNAIYYYYLFQIDYEKSIKVSLTDYPTSGSNVIVLWATMTDSNGEIYGDSRFDYTQDYVMEPLTDDDFSSTIPSTKTVTNNEVDSYGKYLIVMKLTVQDPEQNVSNFSADIKFSITK